MRPTKWDTFFCELDLGAVRKLARRASEDEPILQVLETAIPKLIKTAHETSRSDSVTFFRRYVSRSFLKQDRLIEPGMLKKLQVSGYIECKNFWTLMCNSFFSVSKMDGPRPRYRFTDEQVMKIIAVFETANQISAAAEGDEDVNEAKLEDALLDFFLKLLDQPLNDKVHRSSLLSFIACTTITG
ncbi:hypothetical protein K470DRAFT_267362 [Piedraia hortae CBS 480.64]|uniref:Uncharacterized protein n=1 Tax=Piedraia hortae CBS 480.64 TaxID=1314780 RepID=A0A6A7CCC8_9PEZI|nr:hypothetical protein K470DRAFT_267362 [Piedraia hortae CBS 480.64]